MSGFGILDLVGWVWKVMLCLLGLDRFGRLGCVWYEVLFVFGS